MQQASIPAPPAPGAAPQRTPAGAAGGPALGVPAYGSISDRFRNYAGMVAQPFQMRSDEWYRQASGREGLVLQSGGTNSKPINDSGCIRLACSGVLVVLAPLMHSCSLRAACATAQWHHSANAKWRPSFLIKLDFCIGIPANLGFVLSQAAG